MGGISLMSQNHSWHKKIKYLNHSKQILSFWYIKECNMEYEQSIYLILDIEHIKNINYNKYISILICIIQVFSCSLVYLHTRLGVTNRDIITALI